MHSTIDSPIEEPHKFLGDLDLTNPVLLRQVMILIHNTLYPTVNDRINCCLFPNCLLSDVQQASFDRIVEETKENRKELLGEMLKWWCAHYGKGNAEVVGVTEMLRRYVSWYVRCPRLYMVEAEDARREWEGFMRRGGKESKDEHEDVEEVEETGKVKGRCRLVRRADRRGLVVSSPERSDARKPKAKVQYKEKTSADEEVKAEESSSSSEEEEVVSNNSHQIQT
jgi:hypothetical protein